MPPMGQMLAAGRVGAGIGALLAPGLTGKAFGLNLDANPESGIWARMFGTRELMLAGAVLAGGPAAKGYAHQGGDRRRPRRRDRRGARGQGGAHPRLHAPRAWP